MDSATPTAQAASSELRRIRALAVGSLSGLIVVGLAWELWLAPLPTRLWAVKVLPLFIPLAGLLRYRMYTYRWVSLLVWLYFTEGLVRGLNDLPPARWLAFLQVLFSLALFAACALHVRTRLGARSAR
ncbi:DUF2069 domain-containing protein [Ramlibacter henchirensis]|nr:DUF2069 domain-containing protein [Ramlibacter henchirensis]